MSLDLVWNVQGSSNSEDIDVVVVVPRGQIALMSVGATRSLEAQYAAHISELIGEHEHRPVDVNLVEVSEEGLIVASTKGRPSKVNNALLSTYKLHHQVFPCIVLKRNPRNLLADSVLSCHYIFTGLTRTASGCDSCAFTGCSQCNLYNTIIRKSRYSCVSMIQFFVELRLDSFVFYNHGKTRICDMLKNLVFQLCQSVSFLDGEELFTKDAVTEAYPALAPFIARLVHDTSDKALFLELSRLKDVFCGRLLEMLKQSQLGVLPASAFQLSERHQLAVAAVLREGYEGYLEQCSQRLRDIVAACPFKCTNAKNTRKYLIQNQVGCVAIHAIIDKTHEVKIAIPLE